MIRLTAAILFASATLMCGHAQAFDWTIETVDTSADTGMFCSIAYRNGNMGISYTKCVNPSSSNEDYNLKYALRDSSGWHPETVDNGWDAGVNSSLVFDSAGTPWISYTRNNDNTPAQERDLLLAHKTSSGSWTLSTPDNNSYDAGVFSSLAIGSDDTLHASYYDHTSKGLRYAKRIPGNAWGYRLVHDPTSGWVGYYSQIALDSQDYPHICYHDYTNKELLYAYKSTADNEWHASVIDSAPGVGAFCDIAIGVGDYPHISYYDDTNNNLCYKVKLGPGNWLKDTVDSVGNVGLWTSIAVDSNGNAHIAYQDATNRKIKYASKTDAGWVSMVVGDTTTYCGGCSLVLDDRDNPHIAYYGSDDTLKYAHLTIVPEPGSALALGAMVAGAAMRTRRSRKS